MAANLLPVCILAGGLGTRLGEVVKDTPKPLLEVAGRPFLLWQLDLLRAHGASRVVLCVGYLGARIEERIGDGAELGLDIRYAYDPPELAGTAGAIRAALPLLGDAFGVLYGDTYLQLDYSAVQRAFEDSGRPALMTVLHNRSAWDVSNAAFDGTRVRYSKRAPTPDMEWIDYGYGVLRADALDAAPDPDLAGVYETLSARGELAGYAATERFWEIGTPEALADTDAYLRS
jgi:MurNAc alpha-1-phosphate uridylyltransferase